MLDRPRPGAWDDLLAFDREHVWHPYGPLPPRMAARPVVATQGTRLRLADGTEVIDGMASWWSAIHGHRHPKIVAALHEQVDAMPHVMFGGLTHEPAIALAQRLAAIAPDPLDRVFLADTGSIAVEVALKLCVQRAAGTGRPTRTRMLALHGGYHGDTFGAMSICDPEQGMHRMYGDLLPRQVFAPRPGPGFDAPMDDAWAAEVARLMEEHADQLAGVIVEPIVQGAGGMYFFSPEHLRHLRRLCDAHDVVLVADEIATGFGRTGALLACEHAGVVPDVLCVGKALTGGAMTLAATITSGAVADAVADSPPGALMHGPTFMANPLACAAANASVDLVLEGAWQRDVPRVEAGLRTALQPAREVPGVADVRVLGAIGVVELEAEVDMVAATEAALAHGVWLRPFGRLIYTMPPYVCDEDEVAAIGAAMTAAAIACRAGA